MTGLVFSLGPLLGHGNARGDDTLLHWLKQQAVRSSSFSLTSDCSKISLGKRGHAIRELELVVSRMRYFALLLVGLVLWGLADDFLVNGQQVSPRASACDDDEYLLGKAKSSRRDLSADETTPVPACVAFLGTRSGPAEAPLPYSSLHLRAFSSDCSLYVFMSLQI